MNKTWKKINQRACYNRIWSWSPVPCEKHGSWASVTTKTEAEGRGFCLLSPSGHVFHTARQTMIKSDNACSSSLTQFATCRQTAARQCKDVCWNKLDPINGAARQRSALCKSGLNVPSVITYSMNSTLWNVWTYHQKNMVTVHLVNNKFCWIEMDWWITLHFF